MISFRLGCLYGGDREYDTVARKTGAERKSCRKMTSTRRVQLGTGSSGRGSGAPHGRRDTHARSRGRDPEGE